MTDLVEPGKAHKGPNSDSNKRCPKMFSIALALTFIALVAFAAFLVSDILSLESNSSHVDQGENRETVSIPKIESAAANGSSQKDREILLSTANGSSVARKSTVNSNTAGKESDSSALSKSQMSGKSTATNRTPKQYVVINSFSRSSGGDSHKSSKEKKYSSSESSSHGTQGDTSLSNDAKENRSGPSQFPDHKDLSNNLTLNLSASVPAINATEIPSNNSSENPSNNSSINASINATINATINASANTNAPQQYTVNLTGNQISKPVFIPGNGALDEPITSDKLNKTGSDLHNSYESIFAGDNIDSDAIPSEEMITDSYSSSPGPDSQIAPDDQSQSKLKSGKGKENKRISNRGKSAKSLKKPTPRARPARTRPVRPARDRSRK